jgi:hypothetical protein
LFSLVVCPFSKPVFSCPSLFVSIPEMQEKAVWKPGLLFCTKTKRTQAWGVPLDFEGILKTITIVLKQYLIIRAFVS